MADSENYPETLSPETPLPVHPEASSPDVDSHEVRERPTESEKKENNSPKKLPDNGTSEKRIKSGVKQILVNSQGTDDSVSRCTSRRGSEKEDTRRVVLNVGGTKHEVCLSTLLKHRKSRLYDIATKLQAENKDGDTNTTLPELFFDRDPALFLFILNFYRTSQLHVPLGVCGPMFKKELDFWKLDDREIEPCCFVTYVSYEETNEALAQFDYSVKEGQQNEEAARITLDSDNCWQRFRPKLWKGLQNPYTSTVAMVYAIISVLLVLVSITVFVVETLPYFGQHTLHSRKVAGHSWTSEDLRKDLDIFTDITDYDMLIIADNCCNIFFFVEYLVKLVAAPSKLKYIRSPISVIELLCIIPYYMAMAIVFWHQNPIELFDFLRVLYATRVLRIFRIFVLMKHFMALKILVYTIKASTKELLLLVLILLIGVIIFACMEYYAELLTEDMENASDFPHIPIAFWWALVTMTTVGYGDVYPKTLFGYTIGAGCAISGVLVVALTVPIIVNNFSVYYTHAQSREKLKLRKKELRDSTKAQEQWKKAAGVSWSWSVFRAKSHPGLSDKKTKDLNPTNSKPTQPTTTTPNGEAQQSSKPFSWLTSRKRSPNKVSSS